jgi:hypothetical protein
LRVAAKAVEFPPGRHEGFLRYIVSLGRRADGCQRGTENGTPVPLDEFSKRVNVAGLRQADQVEI